MRYVVAIIGLVALLGGLAGLKFLQISTLIGAGEQMEKAGPPPEAVSTALAQEQAWESTLDAIGSVVSARGVAVSNDAPGIVARLHFESGSTVRQGQVLVELDSSVERAQLGSVLARLELAETSRNRSRALVQAGVVAQAQMDTDESSFKSLTAEVRALRAQIERKIIRAPFSGKLGLRQVNLGQYLAPGTTIAVLESTESVFVDFTLPQHTLAALKVGLPVRASEAESADAAPPLTGTISAIDPTLDAATRAVQVRASFQNDADRLRPGMFLRVSVILPESGRAVVIPATAVVRASYGDSVFLVEDAPAPGAPNDKRKVARQQFVRLGEMRGDFVSVLQGIEPGQEVVSAGAFKLRNGAPLLIDNASVKLDPKLAPRPANR